MTTKVPQEMPPELRRLMEEWEKGGPFPFVIPAAPPPSRREYGKPGRRKR